MPHLIHKARALGLLAKGDVDKAVEEVRLSHRATPGNAKFVEDIIPQLEKADRKKDADELFEKSYALLKDVCGDFPNSALHHNNLAWMSARCGRRLKEALKYSQKAVELEPDNAGYIDTLGEVFFRLGQRDNAIEYARKCSEISPDNEHFQKQLKRFQEEPAPSETK